MKILALETSAKSCSVAVAEQDTLLGCSYLNSSLTHSATLLPMVERLLSDLGLSPKALDGIAVSAGPGSFTGLRIGIAAAKGLAWANDLPCLGVSTLEAMALPLSHASAELICAMDARRNQVYNACFQAQDNRLTRLTPDRALGLDELAQELQTDPLPKIVVGDGALLCYHYLIEHHTPCTLAPTHLRMQSAVGVAQAAQNASASAWGDAQSLVPRYLRLSQAERERQERLQKEKEL